MDLFCYLPDQESPWTDRSWTEIGLVDGNVLDIGECTLMPGKKSTPIAFFKEYTTCTENKIRIPGF